MIWKEPAKVFFVFVTVILLMTPRRGEAGNGFFSEPGGGQGQPKPAAAKPKAHFHHSAKSGMLRFEPYIERPIHAKVWFDSSAYYFFSDTAVEDRFWIKAVGDYDYKAIVYFRIVKQNGTCIYRDSFPLLDLLSIYIDGGGQYATRTRKEEVIQQYVEEFFYEGNLDQTVNDLTVPVVEENFLYENLKTFENEGPSRSFVYTKIANGQSLIAYNKTLGKALKFYEYH